MRRVLAITRASAFMVANAYAQDAGGAGDMGSGGTGGRHQQRVKTAKTSTPSPKADDKAYNAALKSIPDKLFDALGGVR